MPPPNEFDRGMQVLESEIKRLEAEYNMFFAGRLPRLPWERKARVETLVKSFDRAEARNTADRFRFQSLQARFVKFLELWERQLRDREEGGRPRVKRGRATIVSESAAPAQRETPAKAAAPSTKKKAPEPPRPATPAERELHVVSFTATGASADRVKELYDRVADARREVGEAPLAMDRIAALVNAQLKKHGADDRDVTFRIALKDGKVSLTVKPED